MARRGSAQLPEFVANPATTPPKEGGLLEHLAFEHRQIEHLWSELQVAHTRKLPGQHRPGALLGGAGQHELSRRIVTMLAEHQALELERLYPAVSEVVGPELAEHLTADHEDIRQLLDEVDGEDPADEEVFEGLTELMTKVLAHIDEEERIAFSMLRALLSSQELQDLGPAPQRSQRDAPAGPGVIDLAAAEREQAEPVSAPKRGLGRRLLRRR